MVTLGIASSCSASTRRCLPPAAAPDRGTVAHGPAAPVHDDRDHVSTSDAAASTSAGNIAQVFAWSSFILVGIGLLIRAYSVGRGPWGNLYEFSIAFGFGIMGGYLFLSRRYPIKAIAFIPIGIALFLLTYAFTLPAEHRARSCPRSTTRP